MKHPTLAALERLNGLLPLKARQARLPAGLRQMHLAILRGFMEHGEPPSLDALTPFAAGEEVGGALARLADDDLVVLTADRTAVTGAYPFTTEARVHRVIVNGHEVHAMCALDALSVAPMFRIESRVNSRCHVHGTPVEIAMSGASVLSSQPPHPCVGIRWQATSGCAASSLCLEMVFLRDTATAEAWKGGDTAHTDIFELPEAVAFGAAFFRPLLD